MNITCENISFILLAILSVATIVFRKKSRTKLVELLKNPFWLLGLLTIGGFSIYVGVGMKEKKLLMLTKKV